MTFFCWRRLGNYHLLRRKFCIMRLRFIYNGKFRFWNHADSENMQFTSKKKDLIQGKIGPKCRIPLGQKIFSLKNKKAARKTAKKNPTNSNHTIWFSITKHPQHARTSVPTCTCIRIHAAHAYTHAQAILHRTIAASEQVHAVDMIPLRAVVEASHTFNCTPSYTETMVGGI